MICDFIRSDEHHHDGAHADSQADRCHEGEDAPLEVVIFDVAPTPNDQKRHQQ